MQRACFGASISEVIAAQFECCVDRRKMALYVMQLLINAP
jgi:hypothetical protein